MESCSLLYKSPQGITLRKDQQAMFGFLPKEGFAFFGPAEEFESIRLALSKRDMTKLPVGYERLQSGRIVPFPPSRERSLGSPHHHWRTIPTGDTPLIINWMLTGSCNYRCSYCYAQDLMHEKVVEPDHERIFEIINNIKSFSPVAVVITGGEPTVSPFFCDAIATLSRFTSVVVDTNATLLTDLHVSTFADMDVHVRVSLDSHRPQINCKTRIPLCKKQATEDLKIVFTNLDKLKHAGVPVTINTVASTSNYDDIKALEDVLKVFDVSKIRVRLVEDSICIADYKKLTGDGKRKKRFVEFTSKSMSSAVSIPVYCSFGRIRNSIVIVSPSGCFFTESLIKDEGKILIDEKLPLKPTLDSIRREVDMHAHSSRYLVV